MRFQLPEGVCPALELNPGQAASPSGGQSGRLGNGEIHYPVGRVFGNARNIWEDSLLRSLSPRKLEKRES